MADVMLFPEYPGGWVEFSWGWPWLNDVNNGSLIWLERGKLCNTQINCSGGRFNNRKKDWEVIPQLYYNFYQYYSVTIKLIHKTEAASNTDSCFGKRCNIYTLDRQKNNWSSLKYCRIYTCIITKFFLKTQGNYDQNSLEHHD